MELHTAHNKHMAKLETSPCVKRCVDMAGTSMVIDAQNSNTVVANTVLPHRSSTVHRSGSSTLHCGGSRHGHTTNQWSQLETAPLVNRCGASFDKIIFIGERYAISRGVS